MNAVISIFEQYGWSGINAVVTCIVLFYVGKYVIKKLTSNMKTGLEDVGEKLTNKMAEQNEHLVHTIIGQQDKILTHILDNHQTVQKNHNDMLGERMALTEEIKTGLKDIGHIHGAQRVFVIEFHNSNQNLSPFSCFSGAINKIYNSHEQQLIYKNIEDLLDDCPALRDLFTKFPCNSIACTAMYDRDNVLIGALVLEFIDNGTEKLNVNQLHIQAAELTSLINIRYKYLN